MVRVSSFHSPLTKTNSQAACCRNSFEPRHRAPTENPEHHRPSCHDASFFNRHPVNAWFAVSIFDTLRSRPKSENQSLAVFMIEGNFQNFLTPH